MDTKAPVAMLPEWTKEEKKNTSINIQKRLLNFTHPL